MKQHAFRVWMAIVATAAAFPAAAGFRVDDPAHRPQVHPGGRQSHVGVPDNYVLAANLTASHVEEIGQGTPARVTGFGKDIPLEVALEMIMPDGWVGYVAPSVDTQARVSWPGDQTWVQAIEGVAVRHGLRFFIDWNTKVVRVDPMSAGETAMTRANARAQAEEAEQAKRLNDLAAAVAEDEAQRQAQLEAEIANGEKTWVTVEGEDGKRYRRITSAEDERAAIDVFTSERISLHVSDVSLAELIEKLAPEGWGVRMDVDADKFSGRRFDFDADNTRKEAISTIEAELGLSITPYPTQKIVVVSERKR